MTKVYAVIQRTEMAESLISLYESREDAEDNAAKRNILAEGNEFYVKPMPVNSCWH